jgi:hypothetical protein
MGSIVLDKLGFDSVLNVSDKMDVDLPNSSHIFGDDGGDLKSGDENALTWFDAVKESISLKLLFEKMNSKQIQYLEDFIAVEVYTNAIISLPLGVELIGSSSNFSKIFIRSTMMQVWKVLCSEKQPIVLQGSPGCGKTSLVWLWALSQGCERDVLYVSFLGRRCFLVELQKGVIFASPQLIFHTPNDCGFFVERLLQNCEVDVLILDGVKNRQEWFKEWR